MQIIKRLSPCEILIRKTFSKDDLKELEEKILKTKRQELNIPGFRPGKAPLDKVREKLMLSHSWEELMGIKLQETIIANWAKKKDAEMGEIVRIINIKTVKEEPLTLECHFEYFPRLEKAEISEKYKQLKISQKQNIQDIKITDEEVAAGLSELQKRRTVLQPVDGVLEKDKYAFTKINCCFEADEQTAGKETRDLFQWGIEQYGKFFDQKTKGMREGEERTFTLNKDELAYLKKLKLSLVPTDDSSDQENKLGVKIKVSVEKVFVSEIPKINDDFAKSLGHFHSLADLKTSIKHGITLEKLYKERDARRESLVQTLLDNIEIAVPDSIVERNAANYKREFEKQTAGQNQKFSPQKREKINQLFKEKSKKELKLQRILEAIALKEKIVPSEEAVEKEVHKILQSFTSPKEARDSLGEPEELKSRVMLSLCFEETLQFLEKENDLKDDIEEAIAKIEKEQEHYHHS